MLLELDLDKIARTARQKERENFRFRTFLKGQNSAQIDEIVHALNDEVSAQIDCTKCGNCCMQLKPSISDRDVHRLSQRLDVTPEAFTKEYLEETEEGQYFRRLPCAFLDGCRCSVYDDRPKQCRAFPYLHKKEFISRLWGVIDNYSICPIVFNVVERLKRKLNFR